MPEATNPSQGGSYTRDPVTGDLTLVERTAEAPIDGDAAAQPAAAAPAPQPQPEA